MPELFSKLEEKRIQGKYNEYLKRLEKYDLLIIDEFLLKPTNDIIKFGGQLMSELKTVYKESDIIGLSKKIYDLWKLLPDKIKNEEPFYTLNYVSVR